MNIRPISAPMAMSVPRVRFGQADTTAEQIRQEIENKLGEKATEAIQVLSSYLDKPGTPSMANVVAAQGLLTAYATLAARKKDAAQESREFNA
jgi:hypothetical protein